MSAPRSRRTARGAGAVARRAVSRLSAGARRVALDMWLILQTTVSATAAWGVARYVLDHPAPYFAPISAMIALTANLGERGLHAVRLLLGVILGLTVGEFVLLTVGTGPGSMALGIFVALTVARAARGPQVIVVQAAVSTVLVVALGDQSNGIQRLVDVLVGAGIALVFTQILFPPEPLALLRRAEKAALTAIAGGLATTAQAIARDDNALAERAVGELRDVQDHVTKLRRAGRASTSVARRTLVWRGTVVVRERENAEHLGPLGADCFALARLLASADSGTRGHFQQPVRDLADVASALARGLSERAVRQQAADRSLEIATRITAEIKPTGTDRTYLSHSLRMVATDIIAFAGVDFADAIQAVRVGALEQRVPPAAPASGRLRSWLERLRGKVR